MRNPYMKFQNSSIHGFKVMLCIKKRDERTDGRKDGRTNNPEAICPSNFFEVGGITKMSATILQGTIQGSWTIVHLDKLPTFGRRLSSRIYKMHKIQPVCHIQFSSGLTLPDDRLNYPMILQANSEAPIREHKLEGLYRSSLSTNMCSNSQLVAA